VSEMEKIFKRAAHGNKRAQAELYNQLSPKIYNLAFYTIYSHEDAQDITQETFARLIKALEEGKVASNPVSYAYSIARNLCMDQLKQGEKMVFDSEKVLKEIHEPYLFSSPEKASLLQEQMDTTVQAALALNPSQRMALNLRELDELSYEQIGEIMGLNRNAVAALLFRARRKFKEVFRMAHIKYEGEGELCQDISMLLSAYIDDELDEESHYLVEEHLEDCPLCRLSLEEMEEASVSYRSLIPLAPIALAHAGLLARLFSFFARLLPGMAKAEQLVPGVKLLSKGAEVGYVTFRAAVAAATAVVLVSGAGGAATITANERASTSSSPVAQDNRKEAVAYIDEGDIYLYDIEGEETWQLTDDGVSDWPCISPDGSSLVFTSCRPYLEELQAGTNGQGEFYRSIFLMDIDGGNRRAVTGASMGDCYQASFTSDGEHLVFVASGPVIQIESNGFTIPQRDVDIILYDLEEDTIDKEWRHTQQGEDTDFTFSTPQYLAEEDNFIFVHGGHQPGDSRLRKATPGVEGDEGFWDYPIREYMSPCLSPDGSLVAGIERWMEIVHVEEMDAHMTTWYEYAVFFDNQGNPQRGKSICIKNASSEYPRSRISWVVPGTKAVTSGIWVGDDEPNLLMDFADGSSTLLPIQGYSLGGGLVDFNTESFASSHELFPPDEPELSYPLYSGSPEDSGGPIDFSKSIVTRGMTLARDGSSALALILQQSVSAGEPAPAQALARVNVGPEGRFETEVLCDLSQWGENNRPMDAEWWEEKGYVAIVAIGLHNSGLYVVDLGSASGQPVFRAQFGRSPSWARLPSGEEVLCYESGGQLFMAPALEGDARLIETSGPSYEPAISPDGSTLAFVRHEGSERDLIVKDLETGEEDMIFQANHEIRDLSWSEDGSRLLYVLDETDHNAKNIRSILYAWTINEGEPKSLLGYDYRNPSSSNELDAISGPRFSGDGSRIYFGALAFTGYIYTHSLISFHPQTGSWAFINPDPSPGVTYDFIVY
jgi:RNA polymerase sigma-70 factor (ECF subfamily)